MNTCPSDWGAICLERIDNSSDFWSLYTELIHDQSVFVPKRGRILDAYKDGNLYGLRVIETDGMYERCAKDDILFCSGSSYLLPCFCVISYDAINIAKRDVTITAIILWTHTRARRHGFATKLVELLNISYVYHALPNSMGFWNKRGVKLLTE